MAVFGSINIAAEMAITMGEDPRPFLSKEEIEKQAELSKCTVEEWNLKIEEKLRTLKCPF